MCAFSMSITVVNEIALITMLNDDGISSALYSRHAGKDWREKKTCWKTLLRVKNLFNLKMIIHITVPLNSEI